MTFVVVCQEFCLVHYAGPVTYDVNGFLDKNSDLFFRDLKQVRHHHHHHLPVCRSASHTMHSSNEYLMSSLKRWSLWYALLNGINVAFSALALLVGRQEGQSSNVICRLFVNDANEECAKLPRQ